MTGQHIAEHSDIEITCHPADGILTISAETVGALDLLALTMPAEGGWRIDVLAPSATLTAQPARHKAAQSVSAETVTRHLSKESAA